MKTKIVYLINQLGLGGSEKQLYLLLKEMDKTRFQIFVIVFNPSPNYTLDDDLKKEGVEVHPVPLVYKNIFSRLLWIYHILRRLRPHVVHSWSVYHNPYAGLAGWLARVPCRLGSVRGSLFTPYYQRISILMRWLILHTVQGFLVNAHSLVTELESVGVASAKIYYQPNCVESFNPKIVDGILLETLPDKRLIGVVANLRREKNLPFFVRGVARIISEFPDVCGVIVGQPVLDSDPLEPELIKNEIEKYKMQDHIYMMGFHPNPSMLLSTFEIFCLPSRSEGTPNAILESMAAGLPVVSTYVGGVPQIVEDGKTGLLVSSNDDMALAEALKILLRDPRMAKQMGMAGKQKVDSEFNCAAIVKSFEKYYLARFGA